MQEADSTPVQSFKMGSIHSSPIPRADEAGPDHESTDEEEPKHIHGTGPKLGMLPLIALIFYEVSGGPFGVEDVVRHGGPLMSILGFLIFPLVWSVPEALITAELATAFPENGGYVVWIAAAFGDFWGFQEGWWKWLSGVIDNSLYPVLFLDYAKSVIPALEEGPFRLSSLVVITATLTWLNYRGLSLVGNTAVALAIFSLAPFAVMALIAIPHIKPSRWMKINVKTVDWRGYLNVIFWNLNYWDSASTLAGEVDRPRKTFPKALFFAVLLVVGSYLIPLMIGTGAVPLPETQWRDGFFSIVANSIGGKWLMWWVVAAAALSNIGLFEAEMSSDSFQLLGMSERGMLPEVFSQRSKFGTPTVAILCSATGVVMLSWLTFEEIVELLNFLYCIGMLLEFAAFIRLRISDPDLPRPYRIPLSTLGCCLMVFIPTILLIVVMALASFSTVMVSIVSSLIGLGLYPLLCFLREKGWVKFMVEPALPDLPYESTHGERAPLFPFGHDSVATDKSRHDDTLSSR